MYYNPNTYQTLSDQDLKNLLNISFPKGKEQVQEWLLVHDVVPEPEEGKILVKSGIEMQNGIPMQAYSLEDALESETGSENGFTQEELSLKIKQISERFDIIDGAIEELAAMISNLHTFCSNAVKQTEGNSNG